MFILQTIQSTIFVLTFWQDIKLHPSDMFLFFFPFYSTHIFRAVTWKMPCHVHYIVAVITHKLTWLSDVTILMIVQYTNIEVPVKITLSHLAVSSYLPTRRRRKKRNEKTRWDWILRKSKQKFEQWLFYCFVIMPFSLWQPAKGRAPGVKSRSIQTHPSNSCFVELPANLCSEATEQLAFINARAK